MKTNWLYLVLVVILTTTTLGFIPSGQVYSSPSDDRVGGIDFDAYCRSIGATHHGIDTNKGRDGVYCQFDSGGKIQWLTNSNIDQACRNQYGSNAYAAHDGTNHPYAWYCSASSAQNNDSNSQPSDNPGPNTSQDPGPSQNQNQPPVSNTPNNTTAACSGYIKDFLSGQLNQPSSGKYLTTSYDKVLLRSGSGQDKCTYGWLVKDHFYPVLGQNGGWYKIQAGGITGWVMASYVRTIQGSSPSSPTSTNPPTQQKMCEVEVYSHFKLFKGGYILEIPKTVQEPYEVLFKDSLVPDAGNGVQHNGFAGETSTTFFLGISTRFASKNKGVLDDWNWKVRYPC